ncbi:glycine betaine ABC transporter substrate-binding protein [Modestobacter sp. VKM Ac-2979]|uniref:glycine betaine ABC transporter substrate-binding protein n=1 Tax=unclassified Modestobacter TaxID=2643866 RepID=UPI0022ABC447|nr:MULTISPECIES: glycine betaine ABC transporter substrate-binding protein [unclassified Modestobacter]MCZ2810536.1 glycine betaine ABC transporter substrate-binding protein [Modestobacter sp. VKM Ac-2979]MCZ2842022.1 glycine betaine ABC transporter substrate-binding protein [Modestobacter sp. VKM Ac-2980]
MNKHLTTRGARLTAGLAAVALTATACGGDAEEDTTAAGGASAGGDCETVNLGFIPSWTDGLSMAHLWDGVLGEQGIEVEMTEISEAAPLYAGLAGGDVDVYPSAWSEVTHSAYMEEYGDQLEDLGAWYEGAKLTFAVPEYTDIESIADLTGNAEMFDGRIVGIEPGAGLTATTKDSVMPTYGLEEDYTLVESSTTAMLAELQAATDANEDIVVTLWRPFWANSEFPVKDLADPEGALGDSEGLHTLAREGFAADCADVASMMENATLTDEQYGSLENMVVNEYGEGRYDEAVDAWLEENPDFMESLQA